MSEMHSAHDDPIAAERWKRIIRIQDLQATTALEQAQTRVIPLRVWSAGAAAGGTVAAAFIVLGHFL